MYLEKLGYAGNFVYYNEIISKLNHAQGDKNCHIWWDCKLCHFDRGGNNFPTCTTGEHHSKICRVRYEHDHKIQVILSLLLLVVYNPFLEAAHVLWNACYPCFQTQLHEM